MTYHKWTHPECDTFLVLDPAEFHDPVQEKIVARDHLCPDQSSLTALKRTPIELTPEEFESLGEFEG